MKIKSFVLGAALLSAAGLSTSALAYTHHPASNAERKQTDDLNAQQLAQAQQPMANAPMSNTSSPVQQNNAMMNTSQPTMAPADQQNQDSTKPAQPGDQNMQAPQAQTPPPSPQQ